MKTFEYIATDPENQERRGRVTAENVGALRWSLREEGLRVVTAQEVDATSPRNPERKPLFGTSVRGVDLELTLRQLVVLLRSGMTLLGALETTLEQASSRGIRRLFSKIRDDIENGAGFAEALSRHRAIPSTTVAMVGLGEESGNLDLVLERSASTMENRRRLRNATLTALFYPLLTITFAIGISIYMVVAVIPPMKRALDALGRKLPPMTQSLVDISDFFQRWGVPLGVGALVMIVSLIVLFLWPPGRLAIDRLFLRLPLIGRILRTAATALFSRTMSTLLSSGIPLVDALRVSQSIMRNRQLRDVVDSARQRVLGGTSFADGIDHRHAFMPMMVRMIGVGEASGNLEETLQHAADFHEEQLQVLVKQLSALIEPAIILVVGFIVGYVYIAFFVGLYGTVN